MSYNRNSRNNNYNRNDNYQEKKRSGCTAGLDKNSNPYVRGWKYDKRNGLRTFYAAPYKGTKRVKSKTAGKEWENWSVKVEQQGQKPYFVSGLYEVATKRVIIKDLQFIMSPKKNYLGTYVRSK